MTWLARCSCISFKMLLRAQDLWVVLIILGWIGTTVPHLNLYMDSSETLRLLGVTAELYYVRNGIINDYALSFKVPLRPEINDIYFTWQSLQQKPPPMLYNLAFTISNIRAMDRPVANITSEGMVPKTLSVFKIHMPCTGRINADVDVGIQMNISIFSAVNVTVLNFNRTKRCRRDNSPVFFGDHTQLVNYSMFTTPDPTVDNIGNVNTSTHIFYIAVGCACALILLVALVVAMYYINSQKTNSRGYTEKMSDSSSSQALAQHSQTFLRADTPNNASVTGAPSIRHGISPVIENKLVDARSSLGEIPIDSSRLLLGEVLLEGTFGRLYHGTLLAEEDAEIDTEQEIFLKTVTEEARPDQVNIFMTDCCMLKDLVHPNLNPVLAVCLENESRPLIVYPYSNEGNLKKFLQKCRMSECGAHYTLSTQQLVYMAIQIIRGIQYLHRRKVLHKDLAVRNCVVNGDLTVKITDNALARDFFPADYNCLGDNENRPVKWLSLEALTEKHFSTASDVWAYGVVLWELMTLGQQPYPDVDPFEMAVYLQKGYRIAQPMNCPDELFAVMACCWATAAEERPKISQLQMCMQDFYTALGRYI